MFGDWSEVIKHGQDPETAVPLRCPSAAHETIVADVIRRLQPFVNVVRTLYIVMDGPPPPAKAATRQQRAQ